jgi:hypothetical protein
VTAEAVFQALGAPLQNLPLPLREPITFYATDGAERFRTLGSRFLSEAIDTVHLIDLGG